MLRQRRQAHPPPPAQSDTTSAADSTSLGRPPSLKADASQPGPLAEKEMEPSHPPAADERSPLLDDDRDPETDAMSPTRWGRTNPWILFAIASGACAAFNGVFAKLTTTDLTTSLAQGIARFFGLSSIEGGVEVVVRCIFFGLNLVFNGVMWTLFTQALAKGHSTTQVSIINTSSNFVLTALLGLAIFSESLPPLWWLGAAMLVAGNVVVGRKDEAKTADGEVDHGSEADDEALTDVESGNGGYEHVPLDEGVVEAPLPEEKDEEDDDILDLGDLDNR